MKNLYRSNTNRIFCGVIGGIGEHINVDPTILRVAWIIVTVFTAFAPGIIAYFLSCFVIPEKKNEISN